MYSFIHFYMYTDLRPSDQRAIGPMGRRTFWTNGHVSPMGRWTNGLSDYRVVGSTGLQNLARRTNGLSDRGAVKLTGCRTNGVIGSTDRRTKEIARLPPLTKTSNFRIISQCSTCYCNNIIAWPFHAQQKFVTSHSSPVPTILKVRTWLCRPSYFPHVHVSV